MKVNNIVERFYNFFNGYKDQEKYVRYALRQFYVLEDDKVISDTTKIKLAIEKTIYDFYGEFHRPVEF